MSKKRQPAPATAPARLPMLVRQSKVFELVAQGLTHQQIAKRLRVSEDTVARDMKAIADEVFAAVRERHAELLTLALAQYQRVIDQAWREYEHDLQREQDLFAGKLDSRIVEQSVKTLGAATGPPRLDAALEDDEDDDLDLGAFGAFIDGLGRDQPAPDGEPTQQSLPLEITTKVRHVRPRIVSNRAQWLKLIADTTREITELVGIKRLVIEHQGKGGAALPVISFELVPPLSVVTSPPAPAEEGR